jgi:hypothetical protein
VLTTQPTLAAGVQLPIDGQVVLASAEHVENINDSTTSDKAQVQAEDLLLDFDIPLSESAVAEPVMGLPSLETSSRQPSLVREQQSMSLGSTEPWALEEIDEGVASFRLSDSPVVTEVQVESETGGASPRDQAELALSTAHSSRTGLTVVELRDDARIPTALSSGSANTPIQLSRSSETPNADRLPSHTSARRGMQVQIEEELQLTGELTAAQPSEQAGEQAGERQPSLAMPTFRSQINPSRPQRDQDPTRAMLAAYSTSRNKKSHEHGNVPIENTATSEGELALSTDLANAPSTRTEPVGASPSVNKPSDTLPSNHTSLPELSIGGDLASEKSLESATRVSATPEAAVPPAPPKEIKTGAPVQLRALDLQEVSTEGKIVEMSVEHPEICELLKNGDRSLSLLGVQAGVTRVAIVTVDVNGDRFVELHKVTVSGESSPVSVDLPALSEAMSRTISHLYPRSTVEVIPEERRLTIQGWAASEDEAKQIVSLVRKKSLVPVIDRLQSHNSKSKP